MQSLATQMSVRGSGCIIELKKPETKKRFVHDMFLESLVQHAGSEIKWHRSQVETFKTAKHSTYCLLTDLMRAMQIAELPS